MNITPEKIEAFAKENNLSREDILDLAWLCETGPVWNKRVIPIRDFCLSPHYMNARDADGNSVLYPEVLDTLDEISGGDYDEVVLTGGIGSAKTTVALYLQAYQLYLLTCLRNPHSVFGLDPASEILMVFQNINERLARGVDYQRFKAMIDHAPYFSERKEARYDRSIESELRFPNRIIVRPLSGQETAAIGSNVIGGLIDEVNFMAVVDKSKKSRDGGTYNQAWEVYNSIDRRRKSRFQTHSKKLPGVLCLSSSKLYPGQFTDQKAEEARREVERYGRTTVYVYDRRVWDIKPPGTYSGEMFKVFPGDLSRKARIVDDPDDPIVDDPLTDEVPVEFRKTFEEDLLNALRDIAGHSILARFPFLSDTEAIAAAFGRVPNMMTVDTVDMVDRKAKVLTNIIEYPERPRHCHIDLGLTSDSAGLVIGHVPTFVAVERNNQKELLPYFQIDAVLEIRPPRDGQIQFAKIRNILYVLRDQLGLNIQWVSYDSYQSVDSLQILRTKGFDAYNQSVDKTRLPYEFVKSALTDRRIALPDHGKLREELVRLNDEPATGKIDHPPNGSKDCSDALAGVVYGLMMRRDTWIEHGADPELPPSVTELMERADRRMKRIESEDTGSRIM